MKKLIEKILPIAEKILPITEKNTSNDRKILWKKNTSNNRKILPITEKLLLITEKILPIFNLIEQIPLKSKTPCEWAKIIQVEALWYNKKCKFSDIMVVYWFWNCVLFQVLPIRLYQYIVTIIKVSVGLHKLRQIQTTGDQNWKSLNAKKGSKIHSHLCISSK